jgi:hypothetical protein
MDRQSSRRVVCGGAVVLALVVALVFFWSGADRAPAPSEPVAATAHPPGARPVRRPSARAEPVREDPAAPPSAVASPERAEPTPPPGLHRLRVTDGDGRPVGRVLLQLAFPEAGQPRKSRHVEVVTIDSEARVTADGDAAEIAASPLDPGDPPLLARTGIVPAPGARDHRIVLERGAWLRVRAVLPDGAPLAGASLLVRGANGLVRRMRTDGDGRARAEVPADTTYDVAVEGGAVVVESGKVRGILLPWEGELRAVRPGAEATLAVRDLDSAPIAVRVLTPNGAPAARVRVEIRLPGHGTPSAELETDDAGYATFQDVPRRRYEVALVLPPDGPLHAAYVAPPPTEVRPGDPVAELTLLSARTVSGVVVDSNGKPCPRARVAATHDAVEAASGVTGEDGSFVLPIPEDVRGALVIEARFWVQGGSPLDGTTADVRPGDESVRVVVAPSE